MECVVELRQRVSGLWRRDVGGSKEWEAARSNVLRYVIQALAVAERWVLLGGGGLELGRADRSSNVHYT